MWLMSTNYLSNFELDTRQSNKAISIKYISIVHRATWVTKSFKRWFLSFITTTFQHISTVLIMLNILFVSLKNIHLFSLRLVRVRARCGSRAWGGCIHACVGEAATKGDNHKCVVVSHLPEGKRRRWVREGQAGKGIEDPVGVVLG